MFGIESWLPLAALWPPGEKALFTALPGFTVGHTPGISHHTAFSFCNEEASWHGCKENDCKSQSYC